MKGGIDSSLSSAFLLPSPANLTVLTCNLPHSSVPCVNSVADDDPFYSYIGRASCSLLDNGRGTSEFEFANDDTEDDFCTRPFAAEFNAPYFNVLSASSYDVDDASVTTAIRSGVASSKTNEATIVEGDELETLLALIDSDAVTFCTDQQQMLHLCREISPEYDGTVTLLPASASSDKLVVACQCAIVQAIYAHQEGEYAHLRLVLRTVPMNMHQLLSQEYIQLIRYVLLKNVAMYLRCTKEWGLIYQKTILDPSMPIAEHPSLVLSDNLPAFPMLSSPIEFPCYIDAVHGNDLCCRHSTAGYAVGRRSTAGYGFVLCGATVSYRTKTQFITATCATEAEFLAAVLAANHAKYLRAITNPIQLTCYVDATVTVVMVTVVTVVMLVTVVTVTVTVVTVTVTVTVVTVTVVTVTVVTVTVVVGLASVHGGDGGTVSATATTMPTLPTLPTLLVVVAAGTGSERLAGLELLAPYRPSRFSQQEQSSQEENGFFKTAVL
jgi:hypothetical protein